jgi:hypothetical protein
MSLPSRKEVEEEVLVEDEVDVELEVDVEVDVDEEMEDEVEVEEEDAVDTGRHVRPKSLVPVSWLPRPHSSTHSPRKR